MFKKRLYKLLATLSVSLTEPRHTDFIYVVIAATVRDSLSQFSLQLPQVTLNFSLNNSF